jgi:toxin ParE1/3/4
VDDLFGIFGLIESYAGTAIAQRKLGEIERVTRGLSDFPYIGSTRDDLQTGLRAIPAGEKAVISFIINEDTQTVMILCISYAGSDWMSKVPKRL